MLKLKQFYIVARKLPSCNSEKSHYDGAFNSIKGNELCYRSTHVNHCKSLASLVSQSQNPSPHCLVDRPDRFLPHLRQLLPSLFW